MTKKERFAYIFTICALAVLLGIFVTLCYTGVLYSTVANQVSNVPLGTTTTIELFSNQSSAISFSLSGALLPGEKIPQNINLSNQSSADVYIRAKSMIYTKDQGMISVPLIMSENWVFDDGYYYFTDKVPSKAKIGLASKICLPITYDFSGDEAYIVTVVAEALNSDLDIIAVWGKNPTEIANNE